MAKPLAIDSAVLRRLRDLPKSEKVECLLALCELGECFGQPHVHGALGIRKLGNKLFECRAGLSWRFLFLDRRTDLFVSYLGNHDEIKALLKTGKYR